MTIGPPLIFLYENTVRNFGRLCDRYFYEYSKYHHLQLYGTTKNYETHKNQMLSQFNLEISSVFKQGIFLLILI